MRVTAPETLPLKSLQTTDMMRPLYVPAILVVISPPPYSTILTGLSHPPTHSTHTLSHLTASAVLSSCLPTVPERRRVNPVLLAASTRVVLDVDPWPQLGRFRLGDEAIPAGRLEEAQSIGGVQDALDAMYKPKDEPQGSARLGHVGYFPRVVRNVVF